MGRTVVFRCILFRCFGLFNGGVYEAFLLFLLSGLFHNSDTDTKMRVVVHAIKSPQIPSVNLLFIPIRIVAKYTVDGFSAPSSHPPIRPPTTPLLRSPPAGAENLLRARKHFSQSVDLLKAGNARGLHGLCQACASLASCKVRHIEAWRK